MADIISSDIYEISNTVLDLEKKFMKDVNEDVLLLSTYGYMGSQFAKMMKNTVRMASEWGNETLILKAKFDSTILAKAIELQIQDINATPAVMSIMIGFVESELLSAMINNALTISRNCLFTIGSYNYHLDHDLLIETEKLSTGEYIYTARYIINEYSPNFTKIDNPYLSSPFRLLVNNDTFIFIKCDLVQTSISFTGGSIVSNNILENKTVDFSYDNQLAAFEVLITPSLGDAFYLSPIYEGMPTDESLYCYFNYLDDTTIRIKFDTSSYNPINGDKITIKIHSTTGTDGNFPYSKDATNTLIDESDIIDYKGLSCLIKTSDSVGGKDKKTIDELRLILPKESLAKGVITTETDIDTFFNTLDDDNKLISKKKRHNQIERLYYAYFLAKDINGNVIPTNTINLKIYDEDFSTINDKIIIDADTRIVLNTANSSNVYGYIQPVEKDSDVFVYSSPFTTVINKDLLSISYYLMAVNSTYQFNYDYINNNSFIQFVASKMKIERDFLVDSKFRITMTMTQNTNTSESLTTIDNKGNITDTKVHPVLVLNSDDSHKYYVYGTITSYSSDIYTVEFVIDSDNTMNTDNQILLKDLYLGKGTTKSDVYINMQANMSVYMYLDLSSNYGSNNMIPGYYDKGYTLSNIYTTEKEVDLFYNFSDIIDTGVTVSKDNNNKVVYTLTSVPLVRKSYIEDIDRCANLVDSIYYRKVYIDEAINYVENGFGVDLKFYNTYGPSQTFYIGYDDSTSLDKVNLSLSFLAKLKTGVDASILDNIKIDIQSAIEDLNDIADNLHMINLCNTIKDNYSASLDFFDFQSINDYNALYKYIVKKNTTTTIDQVPEFLCVNLVNDTTPDITINTI